MSDAWPRLEPDEEIKVGWRTLVRKTFRQPDGRPAEYVTKDHPSKHAVAVIALTPDLKVVIAEQFRPGPEQVLQELPGGGVEKSEDHIAAVLRELREETGYASDEVVYLGKVYKDAYTNTTNHYFLAKNCYLAGEQQLDDGEFVVVRHISIADLFQNAFDAKMTDTEAVLLAYDQLKLLVREGEYEAAN